MDTNSIYIFVFFMFKNFKRSELFNRADSGGVQIYHLKAREESFLMHTLSSPNSPRLESYGRLKHEENFIFAKRLSLFLPPQTQFLLFLGISFPFLDAHNSSTPSIRPRQPCIHSIARGMGFQMHILTVSNSPRCNFYDAPNVGGQNNNVAKIKLLFSKVIFIFSLYYLYQYINSVSPLALQWKRLLA